MLCSCATNNNNVTHTAPLEVAPLTNTHVMPVEVAIVMPLTGPESQQGKEYAQMIKSGLLDTAKAKVHITLYDGSNALSINQAAEQMLDNGTDVIIGPMYTEPTTILATKTKHAKITILSLAHNPTLAEPQVFVYGHTTLPQMEQLTNHILNIGYRNFILLLPTTKYSSMMAQILHKQITDQGREAESILYDASPDSIANSVKLVADKVDQLNENDLITHKPVIILSDHSNDTNTLSTLLRELQRLNLDKKALLAVDNQLGLTVSNNNLDMVFPSSLNITAPDLAMKLENIVLSPLSSMHYLCYDAGQIVGSLIGEQYNKKLFLEKLNSSEPFSGLTGTVNFTDSIAQRQYNILQKQAGSYSQF